MKTSMRNLLLNLAAIGLLALFLVWAETNLDGYKVQILNLIAVNAILALSLNLIYGFTGMFSLGHAGFMAIGAYVSALCVLPAAQKEMMWILEDIIWPFSVIHTPFWFSVVAGGFVAAIFGLFIAIPVLRLGGDYLGIATLGFAEIIRVLIVNLTPITNGSLGIKGIPFHALALEIRERVKTLVLTGDTARAIRQAVEEAEGGRGCPEIIQTEDLAGAVEAARRAAGPGDVVVLSPACAAFDRFKNFMERGRAFKELVRSL